MRDLVLAHGVHAQGVEVVDRGVEADDLGDRRGAGLELGGQRGGHEPVERDVEDHAAAAQERWAWRRAAPRGPTARRCRWGRASCGRRRRRSRRRARPRRWPGGGRTGRRRGTTRAPAAWALAASSCDRGERAGHVGHGGEGEQLHAVEQRVEVGEVELGIGGERDPADLEALLGLELEPRDDVGVVLELGEQHGVAGAEVGAGPSERATRLSDSVAFLVKMHLGLGVGGPDEAADADPGRLEGVGGGLGDLVDAAVHVGVDRLVVGGHRVDDDLRLLRRRRRVEEADRPALELALEQREVGLDLRRRRTGR